MAQPVADAHADAHLEPIESRQNSRLKDLRKRLLRGAVGNDGLIALEGRHLLEEAVRSGLRVHSIFLRQDATERPHGNRSPGNTVPSLPGALHFRVAADAFDHACATESPQGIAALVEAPQWSLESMLDAAHPLLIVLAGLQDPGNVGAIFRSAEAFGATGLLLTPGTVNPWNQKVLRASAGSCFRLPAVQLADAAGLELLQQRGIPMYACAAQHGTPANETDLRGRCAIAIGNEGAGIPDAVLAHCAGTLHVPCPGPVESLNAAVATAILLYEAASQRARGSNRSRR
ncbi:MAG: TrmH family RNA methyltransferase [Acidobacteriaceae bacterium]